VARWYEDRGYEIVHMSAPLKEQTADNYLQEMADLISRAATENIFLDRSYYGEACIWPNVYGRNNLLDEEGLQVLIELENSVGVERILMHDPNVEAHWKRCVDNKEPLTKIQFVKARNLYYAMADKYGFKRKTLNDFPEAASLAAQSTSKPSPVADSSKMSSDESTPPPVGQLDNRTPQQVKLDRANAINDVLAKRIIKGKGPVYDELERAVRGFLNTELGKLFGSQQSTTTFSSEEVQLLKFFCERLKEKENS
jgi:hypothetical protein